MHEKKVLTCSNQTVEPACRVIKVIRNQWIWTTEQVEQHKEVLEKMLKWLLNIEFDFLVRLNPDQSFYI